MYCCLASRADNATGIAWPEADTIARDCSMARNTVWKSLRHLEEIGLIRKSGKPFAGSNRYQVLVPTSANEIPIELPISANGIPIETAPNRTSFAPSIVSNLRHQSAQMDSREGTPSKVLQERFSNTIGELDLPFQSDSFRKKWSDWVIHRKEIKKPLTPTAAKQQLVKLKEMGEPSAVTTIERSINAGWTGLFEQAPTKQTTESANSTKLSWE